MKKLLEEVVKWLVIGVAFLLSVSITALLMAIGWAVMMLAGAPVRHYSYFAFVGLAIFLRGLLNAGGVARR